jgi:hypothetical protein
MPQLRFGIKGGYDVIDNKINMDILNANNRLGFQIGGTMELMFPAVALGGELSVLYGRQQYDTDNSEYDISEYNYLRVPLSIKKKFSVAGLFGVFVSAGPYIEFKLSGGDMALKESINDQWKTKSYGAGVSAGVGIEALNHLELGMYYRKHLTDNYGSDKPRIEEIWEKHPQSWSIDLTYFF